MSPLKKILFTLITLILVLGAAEGALRLMGELGEGEGESIQYGGLRLLPDPQLIFKLAPGEFTFQGVHYRQNRQGWRMGNIPRAKAPGEFRVMFLGDSSIWGDGVEEGKTLSFHAEEILHISTPRKVVTINAATPGYSSLQSRLLLKRDVDRVKPDLVVIASLWSDLMAMGETDASLLKRISTERGEGAPWWTSSALLHELGRITDGLKHGEEPYRMALDRIFAPQKEGHKGEARPDRALPGQLHGAGPKIRALLA